MSPRLSAMERVPELIEAAVKVFGEKGYRGTQMTDVAFEMGVAAGSLYNYVDSKEGLFALCLERMAQGPRASPWRSRCRSPLPRWTSR